MFQSATAGQPRTNAPSGSGEIRLTDLTKTFGETQAVRAVSLTIPHGSYCCMIGPSGCGKTTILRMIAGHETPTAGEILIGNQPVVGLPPVRRGTALMFQSYALFPHLSVRDNVGFNLKMRGEGKSPVLRGLEGYWPSWAAGLRERLVARRGKQIDRVTTRWQELALMGSQRTRPEEAEFARLEMRRGAVPTDPRDRMPTKLGDVLRAMESRPRHWYGLDAVVCWPRLWLVLPETVRGDLAAGRQQLDIAAQLWVWSLLFCGWTVLAWWALPIGVIGIVVSNRLLLAAAGAYGALVQSAFDVHRKDLYAAMQVLQPVDPDAERATGHELTSALSRGPLKPLTRPSGAAPRDDE